MKGRVILFLFGLPFFCVGAWMTWWVGSDVSDYLDMRDWYAIPATLQRAGYETHRGDDSNTYEAYAQYTYLFDGRQYSSTRVGLSGGADNIGDYQRDTGNRLSSAMQRGESITVFVNPNNPQDAIIDRSLRWSLVGFKSIFMLVFGGVGLGMMLAAILSKKGQKRDQVSAEIRSERPWLDNDDWHSPTIRSDSRAGMWGAWAFAAIWCLISAPLPFVIYGEVLQKENYLALIGLLFPFVGFFLIVWAIRRTREWTRFGATPLEMDPFPGSIGGHVGGTIDLKLPFDHTHRFKMTLTCVHSYVSGSGKNRSRRESAKWQETLIGHAESAMSGTRLTFRFDVPDGLQASDADPEDDSYHLWRLNVHADLPGADYDRNFEIPVYATAAQSSRISQFAVQKARTEQDRLDESSVTARIQERSGPYGRTHFYPAGRRVGAGIAGTLFGAAFAGPGVYILLEGISWFMGSIFAFVGGIIFLFSMYSMLNSLEVFERSGRLVSIRRVLGIKVSEADMLKSDISRLKKKSTMKAQSGGKHTIYYEISAIGNSGQKMVLGEGFQGDNEARAAMRVISNAFGLRVPEERRKKKRREMEENNLLAPES